MNKSKFPRKKIWAFITSILIPAIALFDYFIIKTGLSKFIFDKIKQLSFSDVILLLILFSVSGIYIWVLFINKKVKSLSKENIREVLNKNKDLIRINDELRKTCNKILKNQEEILKENEELKSKVEKIESTEPDPEVFLILESLASIPDKSLEQALLWNNHYKRVFEGKKQSDFQIILNELKDKNLIRELEGEEWSETWFEITGEGLKYLKVLKKKLEGPL
jgi:hypothetical protein